MASVGVSVCGEGRPAMCWAGLVTAGAGDTHICGQTGLGTPPATESMNPVHVLRYGYGISP